MLWNTGVYYSQLTTDNQTVLLWHLDEARGIETASDSSGNNRSGTLEGGDSQIHFYGILPTPTPWSYSLPSINWQRPVLPTLSIPQTIINNPINNPAPTLNQSSSFYSGDVRSFDRIGTRFNGR
jgi:hypothetical protein